MSTGVEAEESDQRVRDLERLVADNPDLERLEAIVADFNPFVAMGWTQQEVRHSAFLRWLLDPIETHGLGSYPLRVFLKEIFAGGTTPEAPTVFDADTWELDGTSIQTEWQSIDLLIRNDSDRWVIVIENKIASSEHSGQLARYRRTIEATFFGYQAVFVYLTPSGEPGSDPTYRPLGYARLVSLLERVIERRRGQLSVEVGTFLSQYVELVRRHIVEDSEIHELCKRLYENHKAAFDLIFEHRPDRALEISMILQEKIRATPGITLRQSSKSYVRFSTPALERLPEGSSGWVKDKSLILFEFENADGRIALKLILGPCDPDLREAVHQAVLKRKDLFNRANAKLYPQWWTFHRRSWLGKKPFAEASLEELDEKLAKELADFVAKELPPLEEALSDIAEELPGA